MAGGEQEDGQQDAYAQAMNVWMSKHNTQTSVSHRQGTCTSYCPAIQGSAPVSVALWHCSAWNRHRRLVARLAARAWYDTAYTARPAFTPERDNSVQSLSAVLQRLAGRCIHRVGVYISPKCARCSVSACCWRPAERVEAHALRTLACVSRLVSPVCLCPSCTCESFAQAKQH